MDRGERGQHRKPSLSVRKPQGQSSPQQRLSPVMRRTRGDEHNSRSGTACRELANATQMHAPRPASAEGKRASTSGVPATSHIAILSASHAETVAGPAIRVRLQTFAKNRGPHEHERPANRASPRKVRVLMLNSGSEHVGECLRLNRPENKPPNRIGKSRRPRDPSQ
jgi:hypothetical protein